MEGQLNSNTGTYAFLFDADADVFSGNYGVPCGKMTFDAVLALQYPSYARVYSGDMVLAEFCQRIFVVKKASTRNSSAFHVDHDLYVSLVTELVRSIKERENIIAIPNIAITLGKHNIFSFTFCGMMPDAWKSICQKLKGAAGFIASFQIDMGNPLHTDLFIRSLIPHGFLHGNNLFLMLPQFENEEDLIPYWAQEQPEIQIHFLNEEEYKSQCPSIHYAEALSPAGMRYIELMEKKGKLNLYQRLAVALLHNDSIMDCEFSITGPFSWEQVDIPEKKLVQYALNIEHEGSGKSKAELFQQLLSITKDDWRYLAAQIENAIECGSLQNVRQTEYGVQFHIDIPIKGLNNAPRIVRTAWIIRQPQKCSLVTAYILDQSQQNGAKGDTPLIVQNTNPALFCSVLYGYASSAGERAAENCIPTPVYFHGYEEPILDGAAGFAWIVIHDARKCFPRWLKKQQIGRLGYYGGWEVYARGCGQSFDRAKAYADAFAKVLRQNGIDCHVESRLD